MAHVNSHVSNSKKKHHLQKNNIKIPSKWRDKMLTNIVIDPFLLSKKFAFSRCPQWYNRWMISHITGTSMGISGTFWYFKAEKTQEILKKRHAVFWNMGGGNKFRQITTRISGNPGQPIHTNQLHYPEHQHTLTSEINLSRSNSQKWMTKAKLPIPLVSINSPKPLKKTPIPDRFVPKQNERRKLCFCPVHVRRACRALPARGVSIKGRNEADASNVPW